MDKTKRHSTINIIYKYSLFIEVLVVFILFGILTKGTFLTTRNLSNLMMQGVTCSVIAITMTLVIVSCNADLSAGTVLGCIGTIAAVLQVNLNFGTTMTMGIVFLSCLAIGIWHAYWIAYKKLPAFIVTLATQLVLKGVILLIGNGAAIGPVKESFAMIGSQYLGSLSKNESFDTISAVIAAAACICYVVLTLRGEKKKAENGLQTTTRTKLVLKTAGVLAAALIVSSIFIFYKGFPYAIILLVVLTAVVHFVINNTSFGRYVFAVGGNVEAAKLSGIKTEKIVAQIYILHSFVVGIASIIYLGRVGQATATAGTSFEFTAITGCVVGGTSILGGRGTVIGAVIGTMLMASLDNGMSLLNMGQSSQYIVKGLVLMFAIAMDVISREKEA